MNEMPPVFIFYVCHDRIPQAGKQQTLTFSQFWRLDIQDQGAGRVGSFWGPEGKDLLQNPLLGL